MSKKEDFIKKEKEQATIKVRTLIKTFAIVIALGLAFAGGWITRSNDYGRVTYEAKQLMDVMEVTASKANK